MSAGGPFDSAPSRTETAALLACLAVASVFVAYDSAQRWRRCRFPQAAGGAGVRDRVGGVFEAEAEAA